MKVLLLSTSYGGVYPSFERALVRGFQSYAQVIEKPIRFFRQPVQLEQFCRQHQINWIFLLLGYEIKAPFHSSFKENRLPPLAVWFTEDPYQLPSSEKVLPIATLAFTVESSLLPTYQKASHCSVTHLPLGYDRSSYYPEPSEQMYDLCFVGYPYPDRVKLLQLLSNKLDIRMAVAGPWQKTQLPLKVNHIATWLPPEKTGALYRQSKIVLNTYRPATLIENESSIIGQSINNRTFEIAACQSFQLTEWKPDLSAYFKNDSISTFNTHDECLEAVEFALSNETWRKEVALKGYETVLSRDSFQERAKKIIEEMRSH